MTAPAMAAPAMVAPAMVAPAMVAPAMVAPAMVAPAMVAPAVAAPAAASAAPVVLGLANSHPLSQRQVGELLMGELRCAACHARGEAASGIERAAPDLADVGSRVSPDFLRRFITSPAATHPGTLMPEMLSSLPADQREKVVEALTQFLVAQAPHQFHCDPLAESDIAAGRALFHTVGCIACHSPCDENDHETTRNGVVNLEHLSAKYSRQSLQDFLFQPLRVRPAGRMPDMKLTPGEAKSLASFLLGKTDVTSQPLKPQDDLVAEGKKYFQQYNCTACHKLAGLPPATTAGALAGLDPLRGCLAITPGKSPLFHLSDPQTAAIRAAIAAKPEPISDKSLAAMTLTAFNCIACHVRDDYGGVSEDRNPLFQTSEKNLGDDARIPPPLTLVGAKLQPAWLKKVLFDGESVRPYMLTRMPQFGEPNLRHLPGLFERTDKIEEVDFLKYHHDEDENQQQRKLENELRTAGRELMGDKGLYCIACHNFNGKPSPVNKGMDIMLTTTQRLKPSWFYQFLRDPGKYRPRIVMPTSWPGGKATQKTILHGDTDEQIEALWYYLTLGTSAPDPSGIHPLETKLQVTDAARTYRGRSSVAGYRGIAVGFPGGLSYAFNAETGTLTALWHGDFIRVDRSGQGSGGFNPAGRFIALAQDVSFFALPDEQTPWPLRPVMTKETPANPDPLYPKNRGYQFKGYYFDDSSIPTFMYRSGDMDLEDRSTADTADGKVLLRRMIQFSAPREQTIWFRALTGKIEAESKQQFKIPELRLSIPPTYTLVRPLAADKNASELLLKLEIPQGKSTVTFTYELFPKK